MSKKFLVIGGIILGTAAAVIAGAIYYYKKAKQQTEGAEETKQLQQWKRPEKKERAETDADQTDAKHEGGNEESDSDDEEQKTLLPRPMEKVAEEPIVIPGEATPGRLMSLGTAEKVVSEAGSAVSLDSEAPSIKRASSVESSQVSVAPKTEALN